MSDLINAMVSHEVIPMPAHGLEMLNMEIPGDKGKTLVVLDAPGNNLNCVFVVDLCVKCQVDHLSNTGTICHPKEDCTADCGTWNACLLE